MRYSAARWAVTAVFAGNGATIASFAVRTPSLKIAHGLDAGQLGLLSTVFGIAAILAMQLAGGLTARVGSARVVRTATLLLPLALPGLGLARGYAQLAAVMVVIGSVHATLDVAMNAHAVAVERGLGRPIMNGCHAAWSLGAVAGSMAGGAAAQAGLSLARHFLCLAAVLVPAALVIGRLLLPAATDRRTGPVSAGGRRSRTGWTRRLLVLGAMGATILTCEAAVANWSGVLLHDHLGARLGVASLGYIAFTACETAGRLVGDRLFTRYPARTLVRGGALLGAAGLVVVVVSPWPALAVAGYAVLGLGLSAPLPVLFSVVGHSATDPHAAAAQVARFTTMTYSGILLGPAVIGWLAQAVGLVHALTALVPLLLVVAAVAATTNRPEIRPRPVVEIPVPASSSFREAPEGRHDGGADDV